MCVCDVLVSDRGKMPSESSISVIIKIYYSWLSVKLIKSGEEGESVRS